MADSKVVLISGVSGFLGEALARRLLKENIKVVGIDINNPPDDLWLNIDFRRIDIRDPRQVIYTFAKDKFDTIFHCAALVPVTRSSYWEFIETNTFGSLFMSGLIYDKFIHISSSAVYGFGGKNITENSKQKPIENYGRSKTIAEGFLNVMRSDKRNIIIVRPRTIIGNKRIGMMDVLYSRIMKSKNMYLIGDGYNQFQLLDLRDCVDALMKIHYNNDIVNEDYNLGTDKFSNLRIDIQTLIDYAKSKSSLKFLPRWTKNILRIMDWLNISPMTAWHYETIDKDFYFDISKACNELDWRPKYHNMDMLIDSYDWYVNNIDKEEDSVHKSKLKKRILNWI